MFFELCFVLENCVRYSVLPTITEIGFYPIDLPRIIVCFNFRVFLSFVLFNFVPFIFSYKIMF